VKSLAQTTSDLLVQILAQVHSTQEQFAAASRDLVERKRGVSGLLAQQEESFGSFRAQFQEQRGQFETLYRRILAFASSLDAQVQNVSPLVQLHDIVVQELENLAWVHGDVLDDLKAAALAKAKDAEARVSDRLGVEHRVAETRKRLTTTTELRVWEAAAAGAGVTATPVDRPAAFELF